MPQIRFLLKKSPALAFTTINEISTKVGKKYNLLLSINFPERGKIEDFESYGTENIGMIIDRFRKTFPIQRELIKSKADRKSTRLNSSHPSISYAVFCLKKKKKIYNLHK